MSVSRNLCIPLFLAKNGFYMLFTCFFCFAHPPGYQLNSSNRTALTGSRDENSKGADRVMPRGHENQTSPAAALFPNSSKAVPNMSEAGDFNGDLNGI